MSTARTIDDAIVVTLEFHNARLVELLDRIDALAKKIRELTRLMHDQRGIESRLARMDQRIDHIVESISAISYRLDTWMPFITPPATAAPTAAARRASRSRSRR